ncbi:hypothetical protein HBI88_079710 [Parastagonospora nodorum]|nr:hypothetical protein HBI97_246110 [Parastagonospora nodorum]KAH5783123.1 hypothetical protein HBI96_244300 [Parastagonospora nodorum]KAH5803205.1 hypothetical protein HBI94_199140 [Parastagonospora nodorum]KAH5806693.1 hypothetical protein HBI93_244640 [Parastagonospora nodorum]KAH5847357.1 hypothetical protein HBI92_242770 [Parastagonospora nodorum]
MTAAHCRQHESSTAANVQCEQELAAFCFRRVSLECHSFRSDKHQLFFMEMTADSAVRPEKRRRVDRVIAACDLCKRRKVKCDGEQPCAYCVKKNLAATCVFTPAKERVHSTCNTPNNSGGTRHGDNPRSRAHSESNLRHPRDQEGVPSHTRAPISGSQTSLSPTMSRDDHLGSDTVVPLEGRILRDAQGKFIFIGDCAPLSFLQTVRHLISSEVGSDAFAIQASRDSIIEVARAEVPVGRSPPTHIRPEEVEALIHEYVAATSGLVDLFEYQDLITEMNVWARRLSVNNSEDAATAVFYLVAAIGMQEDEEERAELWFDYARNLLMKHMCNSMNVATVQGFTLVAVYMLRAFQPNGAYLYFSLAARTAYAIGLHRTEVNASFGSSIRKMRDCIWKSLRVVDMVISTVLGRPPSTSDVDCTVKYSIPESDQVRSNILDPSVQIFMIIERVVVEVYSRKRISIRIADYVSRQLKGWASRWLLDLTKLTVEHNGVSRSTVIGACSTLCSYYYGIMLLTRPFLIYEIYEHLGASLRGGGTQNDHRQKRKYADAALDAAASFVETLRAVIDTEIMPRRMPLIVPWLFTTALVLAVGVLGRSGLIFEDNCLASIRCLDYFGRTDPHARQYSVIVQSLLKTTTTHAKEREVAQRLKRKQASSELFGLLPSLSNPVARDSPRNPSQDRNAPGPIMSQAPAHDAAPVPVPYDWTIYDADFFALPWSSENDQGLQDFLQPGTHNFGGETVADIPLFPIYDQQMGGALGQ